MTHTTLRYRGKMKLWVLNTMAAEATGVTVARHNLSFTEMLCSSATNADNLGHSTIIRSDHSTSETKIAGLPNFAPH